MSKEHIRNIVVISDTHCGDALAICPPSGVRLDDGGVYNLSRMQTVLFNWWEEFWDEWVPQATKKEPFYLVHNGDIIDGVHHGSTNQITHNFTTQRRIAAELLAPKIKRAAAYYQIRGTEAHVGKSGQEEEALGESLGAVPNDDGQYARYELRKKLGKHIIHFTHHIGTTGSSAHETSAVNSEVAAMLADSARWGERRPSVIVRSHRHCSSEVRLPINNGYITGVVTPAWQLKTPFAYKIAGARVQPPQIGGILIRLDSDGNPFTQTFVRHIKHSKAE